MTTPQTWRFLLYGFLLSAVHFSFAALATHARLLINQPEDMIGSGDGKPYWPPAPFADALESIAGILRFPFDWLWTPWMDQRLPGVFSVLLFAATSCLWGFTLAAVIKFLFSRMRFHHAPRAV